MRERAFQVLGPEVVGVAFLDLFAGTGAVGLEALSRGAASAVFVERHAATAQLVRRNVGQLVEAQGRAKVLCLSASKAISRLARSGATFDMAWADPPFPTWRDGAEALAAAYAEGVLRSDGVACLECPERADLKDLPEGFKIERDLGGGASRLVILGRANPSRR